MRAALFFLAALLVVGPGASAQGNGFAGHVLLCTKECRPTDVNTEPLNDTPVNVVLYAHISDALQRAPLNVLPPDPARERDINSGFPMPTVKVREDIAYFDYNWFYFYHLPTFVEYGTGATNQDGPISYPMQLVGKTAKVYWYLSPHAVPNQNTTLSPVGAVGAIPQVNVYARIETGRHPMHGTLIAEGQTQTPAVVNLPGGDYAYEFEVPLEIKTPLVPPDKGFIVSINWYQIQDGERQVTQSDWRIRSGIRFAPRVILPVAEPMRLNDTAAVYRSGVHYLVTDLSPQFGAYDIDPFSLNMSFVDGPSTVGDPTPVIYYYNPHKPDTVRIAWAVPNDKAPVKAGVYNFQLAANNLQGTYRFTTPVLLDVLEFKAADGKAPGIGTIGLCLAIFVGLAFRRRITRL